MKRYDMDETGCPIKDKFGSWVPAEVAKRLEGALVQAQKELQYLRDDVGFRRNTLAVIDNISAALAAADGDEQ